MMRTAFLAAALAGLAVSAAADDARPVVVELFTSQGCSACPPADALLSELAQRSDVLALSEHVDYWDYLGWRDPFAAPEHGRRQRTYAQRIGHGFVYTPQFVVDGRDEARGSDREAVLASIAGVDRTTSVSVRLEGVASGRPVATIAGEPLAEPADVWLVRCDRVRSTKVERGENRGRTVVNHNVVRGFERLATWRGVTLTVPIEPAHGNAAPPCAVLVQERDAGAILGATDFRDSAP